MKKLTLLPILFLLININNASSQVFDDGTNIINLGFGVPASKKLTDDFKKSFKLNNSVYEYKSTNLGTILLKYERGIHDYLGVGLNLEYSSSKATYKNPNNNDLLDVSATRRIWGFFTRFNGHYPATEKLDLYGGLGLGYLHTIDKTKTTSTLTNINTSSKVFEFDYQFTLGIRYMIKEHMGFFAEFGRATTNFQVGVAFGF